MNMHQRIRLNNFDLVRLYAAGEVAIMHGADYLKVDLGWIGTIFSLAPGVPIFYFVSGFLISRSYENNSRLTEFFLNRALRIYPALIVCTLLAAARDSAAGALPVAGGGLGRVGGWLLSQITVGQFYNPDFMRGFGTGVLNGSLWTVAVELQFYVLVPILYGLISCSGQRKSRGNAALIGVIVIFLSANLLLSRSPNESPSWLESGLLKFALIMGCGPRPHLATKFLQVTFVPWFYMFLIGVLAQRNYDRIVGFLSGRALVLVSAYLGVVYVCARFFGFGGGNAINPIVYLLLAATVFSCAYTEPGVSERMLHRNDISYGIYIYHMPIINLLLYLGFVSGLRWLIVALVATTVAAILSWSMLERQALKLKRHPLNSINKASASTTDTMPGVN